MSANSAIVEIGVGDLIVIPRDVSERMSGRLEDLIQTDSIEQGCVLQFTAQWRRLTTPVIGVVIHIFRVAGVTDPKIRWRHQSFNGIDGVFESISSRASEHHQAFDLSLIALMTSDGPRLFLVTNENVPTVVLQQRT